MRVSSEGAWAALRGPAAEPGRGMENRGRRPRTAWISRHGGVRTTRVKSPFFPGSPTPSAHITRTIRLPSIREVSDYQRMLEDKSPTFDCARRASSHFYNGLCPILGERGALCFRHRADVHFLDGAQRSDGARARWPCLIVSFLVHTFGLGAAPCTSPGGPPVTNLYSSAVFIAWVVVPGLHDPRARVQKTGWRWWRRGPGGIPVAAGRRWDFLCQCRGPRRGRHDGPVAGPCSTPISGWRRTS